MTFPPSGATATKSPGRTPRLPPEERFWHRYSPHHEFPLSGTASVALHLLVLVLLLAVAWVAVKLGLGDDRRPVPVTTVTIGEGGGGEPEAVRPGPGEAGALPEDAPPLANAPEPPPAPRLPELNPAKVEPPPLPLPDQGNRRLHADDVQSKLDQLMKDAQKKGLPSPGGPPGPGDGSPGKKGPRNRPGPGLGDGPGGTLTERQRRVLCWSLTFNTRDGEDYARQLRGLRPGGGAILAVPAGDRRYRVIRDLSKRPAVGDVEDVTRLDRIFWVDDKPESVANLARALGIPAPAYFVAFFPEELETHLAGLEKARLGHDFPGHPVTDVAETRFEIVPASGGYQARVVSVTLRR